MLHRRAKLVGTYDPAAAQIRLTVEPLVVAPGDVLTARPWAGECTVDALATVASDGPLLFAAREIDGVRDRHFDGRLDGCALGFRADAPVEARWDFSLDISTDRISNTGPHQLDGAVRQLPMRGIPGANWTGEVHDWTVDRTHCGAIHFHADDLADAEWEPACTFTIPDELPSGVYALRTRAGDSEDHAVFGSGVRIDVANDRYLAEHPEVGLGTYQVHADRHGVAHSSHLRPVMNMKPKGGLWAFTADTNVTAWIDTG